MNNENDKKCNNRMFCRIAYWTGPMQDMFFMSEIMIFSILMKDLCKI